MGSVRLRSALMGVVGLVAVLVYCLSGGSSKLPTSAYRYRFNVKPTLPSVLDIGRLEGRVLGATATREPSAFDLAALSSQYFQLGRVLGDATYYEKAERTAKRSLALLPAPNPAKLTLARLADSRHQFQDAIELAKDAFRSKPSTDALAILVTSYIAVGDIASAVLYAEQAVDMRPTLPNLLLRGLAFLQQGRTQEALYDFSRSVVIEDLDTPFESSRLRALWGRYLITRGDYATASRLLKESLRIWPDNALALGIWGDLELTRQNYAKAQELYLKAFSVSKETLYLVQYGEAKAAAGDEKVARQYWNQAERLLRKELGSSDFGHRLQLAEILLLRGDKPDVTEAIELAVEESNTRPSSSTYLVLARAYLAAGKVAEATRSVRKALKSGIQHPDYFYFASQVEDLGGNPARAAFYKQLVYELNPRYVASRRSSSAFP